MTMPLLLLLLLLLLHAFTALGLECNATTDEQSALARWSQLSQLSFSRDSHASTAFAGRLWVVGGVSPPYYSSRLELTTSRADVLTSYNGVTWREVLEEAPFRRRFGHSLLAFTDASDARERLVLLGGFTPEPSNDIWVSTNGESWTQVAESSVKWSGRGYHCSATFDDRLFVLGGSPINNQVWSTRSVIDGSSSTLGWKRLDNAPWTARAAMGCAAHEVVANATLGDASRVSYLFVMGGWRDEGALNDVWRMDSADNWVQLTDAAAWSPRAWFPLVSFDSRTPGDVQLGARLWIFGGSVIGNGIAKMHAFDDAWFSRDGVDWVPSSSDASGVSTAEWSQVSAATLGGTSSTRMLSAGKWGHTLVPFYRNVTRAFYCGATCVTTSNSTSLSGQVIGVCDAETETPPVPVLKTVMRASDSSVSTITLYPDGCGLCIADQRYINATRVPALVLIAGNIGSQKANEVYRSGDAMLCERDGAICSSLGVCTQGGVCLCEAGKTGAFCDADLDYTVLDETSCFPESARVVVQGRGQVPIGSVRVGESVLALDADGRLVFSRVYYIPHEAKQPLQVPDVDADGLDLDYRGGNMFVRVHHEWSDSGHVPPLELTPDHLIYYDDLQLSTKSTWSLSTLPQKPARALAVDDVVFVAVDTGTAATRDPTGRLQRARVTRIEVTRRREGALTLYTMAGSLVVDGAVCSNFGDYYPRLPGSLARRRDLAAFMLFAPHRALFSLLPLEATADALRVVMDALVLPALRVLRGWLPLTLTQC